MFPGASYSPTPCYGHPVPIESPSVSRIITQITNNLNIINKYSGLNNVPVFVNECAPVVGRELRVHVFLDPDPTRSFFHRYLAPSVYVNR